ncbi:MAG: 50S ribosomal protein L3 [Candidatus Asgardarchaeia archaeon]
MGHRKFHGPKRGSLAYLPRARASYPYGRIRNWPTVISDEPTLLGFVGYKAGMTHAIVIETRKTSPYYGQERVRPVTVIETPPVIVCAIRGYEKTPNGLRAVTEVWGKDIPKYIERRVKLPKEYDHEDALSRFEELSERFDQIRAIVMTQPYLTTLPKKKPELLEYPITGPDKESIMKYAKEILSKRVSVDNVIRAGQFVDVIAVTKGHGFQGPVKRWGIRILQHKSRKTKRGVGAIGPWTPSRVMYTVPRAGQTGYHQRTEYNKLVLKVGSVDESITPAGGFPHYGVIRNSYLLILGSVPGPVKRTVRLRRPIRNPPYVLESAPKVEWISLSSKM